jgi:hypothetical protein
VQTLTLPLSLVRLVMARLAETGTSPVLVELGHRTDTDGIEWLGRKVVEPHDTRLMHAHVIAVASDAKTEELVALSSPRNGGVIGRLILPKNPRQQVDGVALSGNGTDPIDELLLVGAGMYRLRLTETARTRRTIPELGFRTPSDEFWSRTIGALGSGDVWRRLASLRCAIVGCGRTGSLVLSELKRIGIRDIVLVDPDRIEFHNCGEMDLIDQSDVGSFKVEALRRRVEAILSPGPCRIAAISASMHAPAAVQELIRTDVLIAAPDSDAARLGVALLATLYHKVLIDIGTGVLQEATGMRAESSAFGDETTPSRMMGADVRLVVPGDGCLLCWGGLTNYVQAISDLTARRSARGTVRGDAATRVGSLRSLNQLAVATGLRMLEDLVATRLTGSTWVRVEYDEHGRITVRYPQAQIGTSCTLCQNAGIGDAGL